MIHSHRFFLLAILFLFASCKQENHQAAARPARSYPVVAVTSKTVVSYDNYPATIQGKINNDVRAKIQGYVQKVHVDEGQVVQKGQLLFSLETATLNQSAAAGQSAVQAADANIAAAQSAVEIARVEVDKLRPLVEKDIISPIQLRTAEANLQQAQSQLTQAKAVRQQAQANYQSVQANINYSRIIAPISGTVGNLPFKEGSLVGPSDPMPLTTISDTRELYAYFSMNESQYLDFLEQTEGKTLTEKIRHFPKVELVMANSQLYPPKGIIETVTGQIDPQTGTIQFRVLFPNTDGLLSNGNTGTIRIPKTYENALVVPESATIDQQGQVTVFKIVQDTVYTTVIQIEDRVNNLAIVTQGLKAGDRVVAQGTGSLQNKTLIKPDLVNLDSLVQSIKPVF
ncbi:MAG TPA: efflux RND transporter periplasmic adaptor subunit [Saprospiraceae bacterium]|nr:efflux RND transporter periplasmic adaptor subunit [Saprospiraceae bacterium]HMQ81669.1 efflux RND transporter periplasmic adaptor subunit [Saprospiraceae bacterium]